MSDDVEEMTDEEADAVGEFIYAMMELQSNPNAGTLYAFEMAKAELELLGLDPEDFWLADDPEDE